MLSTFTNRIVYNQTLIFSSIRLLHILNNQHRSNVNLHQRLDFRRTSQQSKSVSSTLNCRLIKPDEFTSELENLVFHRFILEAPMRKYLGLVEPDECVMLLIQQILQQAKQDNVSLGIYNDSDNNNTQHIDKTKKTNSNSPQKLPICFIINHIETIDDPPKKSNMLSNIAKSPIERRKKYEYISDILSKVTENIDLFTEYKARRIMQNVLAGIEPEYANQGLFTRLKMSSIELAQANKCDLIYSKSISQYSTRANLKLGFHKARTIDYATYQNNEGQHIFAGLSKTHQACTLTVKDLRI